MVYGVKTEGRTEKSEPKENTILYDYHWLYCYVELVLLFKSQNEKQQEVIKQEEKFLLFAVHTLVQKTGEGLDRLRISAATTFQN